MPSHPELVYTCHQIARPSLQVRLCSPARMYRSGMWILLLLTVESAEAALPEGSLCYILDGILVIYGIVLTILYCKLKLSSGKNEDEEKGEKKEGFYQELNIRSQDTYETLHTKKKPIS